MTIANHKPIELVLLNTIGRPEIRLFDLSNAPIDATNMKVSVRDLGDVVIVEDDLSDAGTRIKHPDVGRYFFQLGNIDPNNETDTPRDLILQWIVDNPGDENDVSAIQVAKIVTARTMRLIPYFKLMVDKSAKVVDEDPLDPCFLGYTDAQLVMYMEGGLQLINSYEPYPTFCSLDDFPDLFRHVLLESSLIAAVMSQELFAIDEDIPNFSDQGNTFVIQHQPQLAAFLNSISQRLDKLIPQMKLKLVNSGHVHVQAGTNFRLANLLSAAPGGTLFRNVFFRA